MTSRLALGTAQFGSHYGVANRTGGITDSELSVILETAAAAGINVCDTAALYGNAESRLGTAGLDGWKIVTKLPPLPPTVTDVDDWVRSSLRESLSRLRQRSVWGLLLHRAADLRDPRAPQLYAALGAAKASGLVSKIGISVYNPAELDELWPAFKFDLVQAPVNVFDQRLVSSGWLDRLAREGVEVHARSIFLQGVLVMPAAERPNYFNRWTSLLDGWSTWLSQQHVSATKACLDFVLAQRSVSYAVVGVDSGAQLRELIAAAEAPPASRPLNNFAVDDIHLIEPFRWKLQ